MLNVTTEELNFAMWYLKSRGLSVNDDKSSMAITVEGMDYLEKNRPSPEAVMKFIKADALVSPIAKAEPAGEPVLNFLSRAIQRHNATDESQARVSLRPK
jgi:hypothetical protein